MTAADLSVKLGLPVREARLTLERLRGEGLAVQTGEGAWCLTDWAEETYGPTLRELRSLAGDDLPAMRPGAFCGQKRWAHRGSASPVDGPRERRGRYGNG